MANMLKSLFRKTILRKLPTRMALRRHRLVDHKVSSFMEQRLETAAEAFLQGLRAAVEEESLCELQRRLMRHDRWERGFAFEGAGMGVTLVDAIVPSPRQLFTKLVDNWGRNYIYVIYVGAGWAFATRNISPEKFLKRLNRLLGWLAVDGCGFYFGMFGDADASEDKALRRYSGYAGRVFRQGYGRALWFLTRGSVPAIG
jgi:hypothetical protein